MLTMGETRSPSRYWRFLRGWSAALKKSRADRRQNEGQTGMRSSATGLLRVVQVLRDLNLCGVQLNQRRVNRVLEVLIASEDAIPFQA